MTVSVLSKPRQQSRGKDRQPLLPQASEAGTLNPWLRIASADSVPFFGGGRHDYTSSTSEEWGLKDARKFVWHLGKFLKFA